MNLENPNNSQNNSGVVTPNVGVQAQPVNSTNAVAQQSAGAVSQPPTTPQVGSSQPSSAIPGTNNVNVSPVSEDVNSMSFQQVVTNPNQNTATTNMTSAPGANVSSDPGAITNEKLKSVEINYTPPSKFKSFLLILFFVFLIAFIIFLPEIQAFVAEYQSGGTQKVEDITTGKLVCTLDTNTTNLDKSIERIFTYTDKKLESAKFTTTTRGDATADEETLDDMANQCKLIKQNLVELSGISVDCDYENGKLVETERFDYKTYNVEDVRVAYTEAGGDIIEYEYGYDIDKVMTSMRQGGFTCNKEK